MYTYCLLIVRVSGQSFDIAQLEQSPPFKQSFSEDRGSLFRNNKTPVITAKTANIKFRKIVFTKLRRVNNLFAIFQPCRLLLF